MADLELSEVVRTYDESPPVVALDGVDLSIAQGELVSIVGPSGSGKSSLLNVIGLIDQASAGSYRIDDESVGALDERGRARVRSSTFGFVFQSFHLIGRRTALENVELGLLYRAVPRARRSELAATALEAVGLAHRASLETAKLSGGERQRVAIARATLGRAPVVVADEPTGNLDSVAGVIVVDQLRALAGQGATVIVVTHDPGVAAMADRQVVLCDGRVVSDSGGKPASTAIAGSALPVVPGRASRVRTVDLCREAWRAIRVRPGRSAAMVAAVAVAAALVVATMGLSSTASSQVSGRFDARRNRAVAIGIPVGDVQGSASDRAGMPSGVEARVGAVAGVASVGVLERHGEVQAAARPADTPASTPLMGISPGTLALPGTRVRWLPGHARSLGRHEILVGRLTARQIELGPLDAAPTVLIGGRRFAVAGLLLGSERVPDLTSSVLARLADARDLNPANGVSVLIETVPGAAPQVARQAPIALDPTNPDRFTVDAPVDPSTLRAEVQGDLAATLLALTGVATLASILGVANAMLLGVLERMGEFGLRRAIGARPVHVVAQTSIESLALGVLGGIGGLFVGVAAILGVTIARRWQPVIDIRLFPLAVLGGALVGVLGGSAASVRASRIQPSDALRR